MATASNEEPRNVLVQDDLLFHGNQGEDVLAFLRRFRNSAVVRGWTTKEMRKYLVLALRGNARDWWLTMSEEYLREFAPAAAGESEDESDPVQQHQAFNSIPYDLLESRLTERFQAAHRPLYAELELHQCRQEPLEDVSSFAARIQQLTRNAYPTSDFNSRRKLALTPFIVGLASDQIRQGVLATNPPTVAEAFSAAVNIEASLGLSAKPHQLYPHRRDGQAMAAIDHYSYQQGMTRGESKWTEDGRPICRYCHRPGHYEIKCRKREKDQRQASAGQQQSQQKPPGANAYGKQQQYVNVVATAAPPTSKSGKMRWLLETVQQQRDEVAMLKRQIDDPYNINGTHA